MSELEALKRIGLHELKRSNNGRLIYLIHDTVDYTTLLKALTPPTEQEVCEALRNHDGGNIVYEGNKFWVKFNKEKYVLIDYVRNDDGEYMIDLGGDVYPPDLLEMIAKFYKGVEECQVK